MECTYTCRDSLCRIARRACTVMLTSTEVPSSLQLLPISKPFYLSYLLAFSHSSSSLLLRPLFSYSHIKYFPLTPHLPSIPSFLVSQSSSIIEFSSSTFVHHFADAHPTALLELLLPDSDKRTLGTRMCKTESGTTTGK